MTRNVGDFVVHDYSEVKPSFFGKKHLLLGNGFSSSLRRDIFSYSALKEGLAVEMFSIGDEIKNLFNLIKYDDFEELIHRMNLARPIVEAYDGDHQNVADDADKLREGLVDSIGRKHPMHPFDSITDEHYSNCKSFLKNFNSIFTLNYDLLLYWVINRTSLTYKFRDGFTRVAEGEPLVWKGEGQNLHYLHGGLHIYKTNWSKIDELSDDENFDFDYIKIERTVNGGNLVDQIQEKLRHEFYPLTVAEGDSDAKKAKILSEKILRQSYFELKKCKGDLYTFGLGLDKDQDNHILDALCVSDISKLYIGVFECTFDVLNRINSKLRDVNNRRREKGVPEIKIFFFDSRTISPWNRN